MDELRLGSVSVRLSGLTQQSYQARCCDLLLPVTAENKEASLAVFRSAGPFGPFQGLRVSGVADLSFLEEFPKLLYLEIVDQPRVDPRPLRCLSNLRGLRLESPSKGIDFSWFPELEVFHGDWRPDHNNLAACQELRKLRLTQFKPKSGDLADLAGATRLEELEITKTTLTSLAGIEVLEDLRFCTLAYASQLASLDAFTSGECGIREFSLSEAKQVASYRPLAGLRYLRRLKLSYSAEMSDLRWTAGMDRLDQFSFVETTVTDGDLSPLLQLPALRYVGTMDKRHYNLSFEKLNALLAERRKPA